MSIELQPLRVAVATSLVVLCGLAAPSANASFPGANGKIAFERDNEIFLMNPDGSGAAPLTSDGIAKRDPVVSADGRFVAYAYDGNIWVINSNGAGAHAITTDGANDQSPAFSPDGRKIAFLRGSGDLDIFSVNIDGTGLKNLTSDPEGSETDAAWSPDGTRIAYTRTGCTRGTNEGGVCIYVMNADGSNQTLLTPEDNYPECPENAPGFAHRQHSEQPSWSPDGTQIAFAGYWNTCKASGGGGDIWVMNANGTGKRRLMDDTAVDRQPSWSPDGSLVAFVSDRIDNPSGPDADIFTVPAAGGAITPLATGLFTEDPDWGRRATFKSGRCANDIRGTLGDEGLAGTSAGDRLLGLGGDDVLTGLGGADCLKGGGGNDKLTGGGGNDTLGGGAGRDDLRGGGGRDNLTGNGGKNKYSAGGGNDIVRSRNRKAETVNCGPGRGDSAVVDDADRTIGCENVK